MTINTIRIATYNIGQGLDDYEFMLKGTPEEQKKFNDQINEDLIKNESYKNEKKQLLIYTKK